MKVYLDAKAMNHLEEIRQSIECDFFGVEYEILEDEFVWIDKCDEIVGCQLMSLIRNIIYSE